MNGSPTAALDARNTAVQRPRLGFLGLGWIGRMRLDAVAGCGAADICALADQDRSALEAARATAPDAVFADSLEALLEQDLDGLVIATPSALHAQQALAALHRNVAVFCQKPLARSGAEAREIVAAARHADLPLGVDYCYRHLAGVGEMRAAICSGDIGRVFAAELAFHNAYGPDKAWFRDLREAGGGCLMDLGTHLLDLALWCLGQPRVEALDSRLFAHGRRLTAPLAEVEDFATLDADLATGARLTASCSWNLHAGCDVLIGARFFGTEGAYALTNVPGSYYDFVLQRMTGTRAETLAGYPDAWGGRALLAWVDELVTGAGFDARERLETVPELLDQAYGRARSSA